MERQRLTVSVKEGKKGSGMTMRWMMALGMALVAGSAAAQDAPTLKSQKEKRSYALGMSLGNSLRKQSIELDSALVIQGLKDELRVTSRNCKTSRMRKRCSPRSSSPRKTRRTKRRSWP